MALRDDVVDWKIHPDIEVSKAAEIAVLTSALVAFVNFPIFSRDAGIHFVLAQLGGVGRIGDLLDAVLGAEVSGGASGYVGPFTLFVFHGDFSFFSLD
ncbi:MAG: hypothetical protein WCA13_14720 [Terriglobales bacterium]